MRSFLCVSLVFLFAATSAAQFSKTQPRPLPRTADTTQRKAADKGRTDHAAKAADQATADLDLANALLAVMDTDGDGVVTKGEMTKALAALRKVHKDSKGNMAVAEKSAEADPAAAGAAAGGDPTQNGAGAPGVGVGRGNEAMARFMNYDTNHDGVLTVDEVPPNVAVMLREADRHRDGRIDAGELQAYIARMGNQLRPFAAGAGPNAGAGVSGDGGRRP